MYPLKFKTIFKSVVWGGEKIAPFKGVETEQHNIGESWELSGVKGNESVVAEGELAGKTVAELAAEYKGELLGQKVYEKTGTEFPLLVKFIDARDDLSIQKVRLAVPITGQLPVRHPEHLQHADHRLVCLPAPDGDLHLLYRRVLFYPDLHVPLHPAFLTFLTV